DRPNEAYQRLLRSPPDAVHERVMAGIDGDEFPHDQREQLSSLLAELSPRDLAEVVRDLAGHDIPMLVDTFAEIDATRPTVIFAYTIKDRSLATEGHPANHSAQVTGEQMVELADISHTSWADPWKRLTTAARPAACAPRPRCACAANRRLAARCRRYLPNWAGNPRR